MKLRLFLLLILSSVTAQGCFVLVAGTTLYGGMEYAKGALTYRVQHSVSQSHEAGLMALRDLDLIILDDDIDQHSALIKFEYDDGAWGRIHVKAITEYVSELKIRIGTFGNESRALIVRQALDKYLVEQPVSEE